MGPYGIACNSSGVISLVKCVKEKAATPDNGAIVTDGGREQVFGGLPVEATPRPEAVAARDVVTPRGDDSLLFEDLYRIINAAKAGVGTFDKMNRMNSVASDLA